MEFSVQVQSDEIGHLEPAVRLCFAHSIFSRGPATHYKMVSRGVMLLWQKVAGAIPLPYNLTADNATDFLKGWLAQQQPEAWGDEPDADGSVEQGWRVATADSYYGVLTFTLKWIVYGK